MENLFYCYAGFLLVFAFFFLLTDKETQCKMVSGYVLNAPYCVGDTSKERGMAGHEREKEAIKNHFAEHSTDKVDLSRIDPIGDGSSYLVTTSAGNIFEVIFNEDTEIAKVIVYIEEDVYEKAENYKQEITH